ncbi:hypothetical protein GCM10010124_07780 [Pilimelia terevasa]|uniref:DUF4360 domain-containing protein n=1 Tax=Pilimelia terevasa TaxID=53372 RepID=A0A8J3BFJ3_9ACTN|nr:DUF4360 domain-containing protein [Pilimelia terevasa]GGK17682.1 hypothetical protein GCM10010124_07780 [Pilimelia terevasa]
MKRTLVGLGAATAAAGIVISGLAAPASAARPARNDDPDVKITDVVLNGTGCKKGDTSIIMSNGSKAMDVIFSAFTAQAGAVPKDNGTTPWVPRANKNCQINLKLSYKSGWTFALTTVTARGFADLSKKTTGKQITTYYFAGMTETGEGTSNLEGPISETYAYSDEIKTPNYSECGKTRAFNMNARVQVDASKSAKDSLSEITLDSKSIDVSTKYYLGWKNC